MAAMGLEVDLRFLSQVGRTALIVGVLTSGAMMAASLLLIRVMLH
jgi:Kef-type K+ transport system membrane component KefB